MGRVLMLKMHVERCRECRKTKQTLTLRVKLVDEIVEIKVKERH